MSATIRRLRRADPSPLFEQQVKALKSHEQRLVRDAVRSLRKDENLPGDQDIDDAMPPLVMFWLRPVPQLAQWISYDFNDEMVYLRRLKIPPTVDPAVVEELLNSKDEDYPPEPED